MEKWNDRLKKAMAARGVIQADLVRVTKKKSPSVSGWVTGNTEMLDAESAAHICELLGINIKWLMFGKGDSGLDQLSSVSLPSVSYMEDGERRQIIRRGAERREDGEIDVPHLNRCGDMGPGAYADDHEYASGYMRLEMQWLRRHVDYSRPENLALIDGRGSSMEPTYRDGDILLVDRGKTSLDVDAVYVLVELATGRLFIKGVQRMGNNNYLMISHNPTNRDVPIGDGSGFNVLGRVVYAWNGKKL